MHFTKLAIADVIQIDLDPVEDERGFFARIFCREEMAANGIDFNVVQCNNTLTHLAGTIRGLHFQRPPKSEAKIVRCLRGAILDVAVDLRANSPTFGQWNGIELNERNRSMVYIPGGFAHGFQTLAPETELLYFHSEDYSKPNEGGLNPLGAEIAIGWPLPVSNISDRDRQLPELSQTRPIEL